MRLPPTLTLVQLPWQPGNGVHGSERVSSASVRVEGGKKNMQRCLVRLRVFYSFLSCLVTTVKEFELVTRELYNIFFHVKKKKKRIATREGEGDNEETHPVM